MRLRELGATCVLASTLCSTAANAAGNATFKIAPLNVQGDRNIAATALNDLGTIVGTIYANITDAPSGFILAGKTFTPMAPAYYATGATYPQAIDNMGNIDGWASRGSVGYPNLFYYQAKSKTYLNAYDIALNITYNPQTDHIVNAIGLGTKGLIFFNEIYSFDQSELPKYGLPKQLQQVPQLSQYDLLASINSSGEVAGIAFGRLGAGSVFVGDANGFTLLIPPNALSASGGYINDSNAVAGSYKDSARAPHGFIYKGGNYTSFDMPETASEINVTDFSNAGRVVGTYTSAANGHQYGFLYNGSSVSTFGDYAVSDNISVKINNKSQLLVALQFSDSAPNYLSYLLTCTGTGC